jgi:hypothetical protein
VLAGEVQVDLICETMGWYSFIKPLRWKVKTMDMVYLMKLKTNVQMVVVGKKIMFNLDKTIDTKLQMRVRKHKTSHASILRELCM